MKRIGIILLVVLVFALFGCTQITTNNNGSGLMALDDNNSIITDSNYGAKVKVGDTVKVDYTGRLTDGTIFDSSVGRTPLEFTAGAGQMIKGFDAAVIGMSVGEKKTIEIPPAEAYGEFDENKVITIDANQFAEFDSLKKGVTVSAQNGFRGVVIEKNDKNAVIDFNPQLAGKTLIFDITLVSIN